MNLQSFDLNLLRVLDALLEEGSTVRAGQRIGFIRTVVFLIYLLSASCTTNDIWMNFLAILNR